VFSCGVICCSRVRFDASDMEVVITILGGFKSVVRFNESLIVERKYIIIVVPKSTICNPHCLQLDREK
jgi:hypothetical protein